MVIPANHSYRMGPSSWSDDGESGTVRRAFRWCHFEVVRWEKVTWDGLSVPYIDLHIVSVTLRWHEVIKGNMSNPNSYGEQVSLLKKLPKRRIASPFWSKFTKKRQSLSSLLSFLKSNGQRHSKTTNSVVWVGWFFYFFLNKRRCPSFCSSIWRTMKNKARTTLIFWI